VRIGPVKVPGLAVVRMEANVPKSTSRGLTAHGETWSLAAVVLVSGSLSAFAAGNPTPTVGRCPLNQLPEISLDSGRAVGAPAGFNALALYNTAGGQPIKDLSDRLADNIWTVALDDLTFSGIPYKDLPKISLAWTKRPEGKDSQLCLQPIRIVEIPVVKDVTCAGSERTCHAGLGDRIWIEVQDLDPWINAHAAAKGRPNPQTVGDLVPFFDGVPVRGVHPENPSTQPTDQLATNFRTVHKLGFTLERNSSNRELWNRLLSGLRWNGRLVEVSVGFEGGDPMPSWVLKEKPSNDEGNDTRTFTLVVLPHSPTIIAGAIFFIALVAFFWLVKTTEILQDTSAPLRPDGQPPYSLARVQMAVWFFLIVAAWFLLFLVTKDADTLTGSVLALLGISAGTAVSSQIMDAGTTIDAADRIRNVPSDRTILGQGVNELRSRLAEMKKAPGVIRLAGDKRVPAADAEGHAEINQLAAELTLVESQQTFFLRRPWLRATYDLLGDDGHISFHRFQIAVWTIVLAFVFVIRVLSELTMPEFSATILGLMGISSGTYLGFKLVPSSTSGGQTKN
jgi:hypothetical protein